MAKLEWTEKELKYLKENYGKLKPPEIAKKLKRSRSSVSGMASRIGVAKKVPGPRKPRFAHQRKRCPGCRKLYSGGKCPRCSAGEGAEIHDNPDSDPAPGCPDGLR